MTKREGKKIRVWMYFMAGVILAAIAAVYFFWYTQSESVLVADTLKVTWTNGDMEQVDLTQNVRKEKITELLGEHGGRTAPAGEELQPRKGDLEISVEDRRGVTHYFHLSHESGEYLYYSGDQEYSIADGEELYQEVASEL